MSSTVCRLKEMRMKRWIAVLSAVALFSLGVGRVSAGIVEGLLTLEEALAAGVEHIKNGNPFAIVGVIGVNDVGGFVDVSDSIRPVDDSKISGLNTEFTVDGVGQVKLTAAFN